MQKTLETHHVPHPFPAESWKIKILKTLLHGEHFTSLNPAWPMSIADKRCVDCICNPSTHSSSNMSQESNITRGCTWIEVGLIEKLLNMSNRFILKITNYSDTYTSATIKTEWLFTSPASVRKEIAHQQYHALHHTSWNHNQPFVEKLRKHVTFLSKDLGFSTRNTFAWNHYQLWMKKVCNFSIGNKYSPKTPHILMISSIHGKLISALWIPWFLWGTRIKSSITGMRLLHSFIITNRAQSTQVRRYWWIGPKKQWVANNNG